MARFRNPRYAPESLERRLSPTGLFGMPMPPAQVVMLAAETITTPEIPNEQVPPDPSDAPLEPIEPPINPIQPS